MSFRYIFGTTPAQSEPSMPDIPVNNLRPLFLIRGGASRLTLPKSLWLVNSPSFLPAKHRLLGQMGGLWTGSSDSNSPNPESRFSSALVILEYFFELGQEYVDDVVLLNAVYCDVVGLLCWCPEQGGAKHYGQVSRVHTVPLAILCYPENKHDGNK